MDSLPGIHFQDIPFTARFNLVVSWLRQAAIATGFPECKFPVIERVDPTMEAEADLARKYLLTDRSQRRLALAADVVDSLGKHLKGIQHREPPPAFSCLQNIFRYRRKKYRSFHHFCVFRQDQAGEVACISSLLQHMAFFFRLFPSVKYLVRVQDYRLLFDRLALHVGVPEIRRLLFHIRFGQDDERRLIEAKLPEDAVLWLYRLLETRDMPLGDFIAQHVDEANRQRYRDLRQEFVKASLPEPVVCYSRLNMARIATGYYFHAQVAHEADGLIMDGGPVVIPAFAGEACCGMFAYGVEKIVDTCWTHFDIGSHYIYPVTRDAAIMIAIGALAERLQGTLYCVDTVSKNLREARARAAASGYDFFVPIGLREAHGEVMRFRRSAAEGYEKLARPFPP